MLPLLGRFSRKPSTKAFELGNNDDDTPPGAPTKVLSEDAFKDFATTIFSKYLDKIEEEQKKQQQILNRRSTQAKESNLEMGENSEGDADTDKIAGSGRNADSDDSLMSWIKSLLGLKLKLKLGLGAFKKILIPVGATVAAAAAAFAAFSFGDEKEPEPLRDPAAPPVAPNLTGKAEKQPGPKTGDPVKSPSAGAAAVTPPSSSSGAPIIDPNDTSSDYLRRLVREESGGVANAKNPNSSARGVGQFIDSTWAVMVGKYGAKHGIGLGDRDDPEKNLIMTKYYAEENRKLLEKRTKKPVTNSELYMAHFMGPGGAGKFLSAKNSTPHASAVQVMGLDVAKANKRVFYKKNGDERSVAEVYEHIDHRFMAPLPPADAVKRATKPPLAPPGPLRELPGAKQPEPPPPVLREPPGAKQPSAEVAVATTTPGAKQPSAGVTPASTPTPGAKQPSAEVATTTSTTTPGAKQLSAEVTSTTTPGAKQPSAEVTPSSTPTPGAKQPVSKPETPRTTPEVVPTNPSIASTITPPKTEKTTKDATLPGIALNEQPNRSNLVMMPPTSPGLRLAEAQDIPRGEVEYMILPIVKTNTVIMTHA